MRKSFLLTLFVFIAIITNNNTVQAQNAPAIAYTTPQVFTVGSAIAPLLPTNSGGAVFPANYGTPVLFTSYATPFSVAIDGSNNVYTTNNTNGDLTKFSPGGTAIFTVNTGNPQASGVAIDGLGNIYVSQFTDNSVIKYDASGTLLATITGFSDPYGIAFDASNNAYVANYLSGDILEIPAGTAMPVPYLTGFNTPYGIAIDAAGNMYVSEQTPGDIIKIAAGTLTKTTFATGFNGPRHLNKDTFGNIYVADYGNNAIKRINPAGKITTILSAGLSSPRQAAFDSSGNLFVADFGSNTLVKSIPSSYSIDAPLPAGLTFDTSSGQISGTPTASTPITTYTITAYNTGGSGSAPLAITIGSSIKAPSDSTIAASAITGTTATLNGFTSANLASTTVSFAYGTDPTLANATITPAATNSSLNAGASSNSTLLLTGLAPFTTYYYRVTATNSFGTTAGGILSFTTLPATNANLASLTTSGGTIAPVFNPAVLSYTTSVNNVTSAITVTPTASDPNAVITINGVAVSNGTPSAPIALVSGANTITATVTAQDGVTSQSYTLTVTKQGLAPAAIISTVATLSNLTASGVSLSPAFSSGTSNYTAIAGYTTSSVIISPSVTDTTATVTVNGVPVPKGSSSANIPLSIGANTITTVVTAQNGSTNQSYTLIITRQAPPSTIATLSNLAVSGASLSPAFAPAVNNYTSNVSNAITSVTVNPAVSDPSASVTVNGVAVPPGASSANLLLNVGVNTITTIVTAQDGITTNTYTTTVNRAASSNAALANLTINNGSLTPAFTTGTNSYTVNVANGTSSISLNPIVIDTTATVTVNGVAVPSGASSANLPLNVGVNTFITVVTAQDGVTTNTYTTTVTRAASSNAALANLTINNGSLTPAFAAGTNNYAVNVANGISSVSISPSVSDTTATVTVNGVAVPSGASSANLPLNVGVNTITTVVVTAQDGITTNTYTTTVTRAASSNAALANLTINNGSLTPAFAAGTNNYAVSVANGTSSISFTPSVSDATATVTVNGVAVPSGASSANLPLNVGVNTFTTLVTAPDGVTTNTYTTTVTRAASSNAALANLTINSGTLTPAFTPGTADYTATVANATTSIMLSAIVADSTATATVNGTPLSAGSASTQIQLNTGANLVTVAVTAQDGVTVNNYTVTITRAASSNAALSDLTINGGTLNQPFTAGTTGYTSSVGNSVTSITITPTASGPGATVAVNGTVLAPGSPSINVPLNVGVNTITTLVTAQDGITTNTYITTVTRAASSNAALANLSLNNGALIPAFAPGTTNYTVSAGNATASLVVTPLASDTTATVIVNGVNISTGSSSGSLPLAVGKNTITTVVTAQDGVTTKAYTVIVTRAPSDNANLNNLTLNNGLLTPAFANGTNSYTTNVSNTAASVTITPLVSDTTATVTVNGVAVNSGASSNIALAVGANTIATVVTAQDGTTANTYTVTVFRAPSTDATLAGLSVSSGALSPIFAAGTTSYTDSVGYATSSIAITPTANDPTAKILVNGKAVISGASIALPLNTGTNTVAVVLTAQDGTTTDTYNVTVFRAPSNDATLASLKISSGVFSQPFSGAKLNYTANVKNATASVTVLPVSNDSNATLTVNGTAVASGSQSASLPLNVGTNTITTTVTAPDGVTTQSYTITVIRAPSTDATLANLVLGNGILSPAFSRIINGYSTTVNNNITSITVTPTTNESNATLTVNGTALTSGSQSAGLPLNVGVNTISIVVTAQNGITTDTYTITVNRLPSADATLADLTIVGNSLNPAFLSTTTSYSSTVGFSTTSVKITPVSNDPNAKITVNGKPAISGTTSAAIALNVGVNTVKIIVTAQNGLATKTYQLTVTRQAAAANANLANLLPGSGSLDQAFLSGTTSYTESVGFSSTAINVTPTASDPSAKITVNGIKVISGSQSSAIALLVGKNTIKTVVTAQNGVTTKTYSITVTRQAASANAALANLTSSGGPLNQAFSSGITSYTESVGYTTAVVNLTPVTSDPGAKVAINGQPVASGSSSAPIALIVGKNVIKTVVAAQNGTTIKTYTLTLTRLAPSSNAFLASLTLSNGTLAPNFTKDHYSYASSVNNAITAVTLTPATADVNATLTVNGISVLSGTASAPIALNTGNNFITVAVTAQNGSTIKTYTVTVTRQTSASSADASLASLSPASSSGTSGPSGPTVAIDAATYPLNAAAPSSGNTSSISSGNIVLSPNFNPDTLNYSSSVDNLIAAMNVTPVTNVDGATITVNGFSVSSGTASSPIDLTVGNNTITTVVTALDGITTKTYILKVKRLEPTSADSTRFITFNDLGQKTYGDPDFDAGAVASTAEQVIYTNSDPNVISITNGKIHIIGAGTATITATLAPNKNYNNIPVETQTLVVNKAKQTISFNRVPVQQRGTSYTLNEATSSAGLPIIYKSSDSTIMSIKGSTLNAIQLGSAFLTATQPGNANYSPAPNVNQLVNIQDAEGDQLLVHQAVSPNGDGVNDFLLIEGIDNYPTNRVAIINLNGETIYDIKGYNNTTKSFDGHSNITGHLQQPGTYFYMVEYTLNGQTRRKTGYFILKVN